MTEHVDTGFDDPSAVYTPEPPTEITATVNPPPEPGLTPEGVDALKAMVALPAGFGPPQMVALARDLAMNIYSLGTLLTNHKLKNAQYEFLLNHNDFFKNALAQQATEWQGVKSTPDRLRAEAAAALEEQLPVLASRMGSKGEKLADTVEAAKLFAKIACVDGEGPGARRSGEGFTITIDLGADTRITVGTSGDAGQGAEPAAFSPVRHDGQGQAPQGPILSNPEGSTGMREVRQVAPRQIAPPEIGPIPEG